MATAFATEPGRFELSDEQLALRDAVRQIVADRVAPRAREIDETRSYPHDVRLVFADHDLFALQVPEEYGGTGTGSLMLAVAIEEVAKACASCAAMLFDLATLPISLFGSEQQKRAWLPRIAHGEWVGALAISEPGAGSDVAAVRTRAERDGGEWVIHGAKNWTTNVGVADYYVVLALTAPDAKRGAGLSAFLVQADRPGFSVGKLEHKLGLRGLPTGEAVFDGVRVPEENLIGGEGNGFKVAMGTFDRSRLGVAAQALGIAQGATDYAVSYAAEREQFGRPINQFQAIAFKLADMETRCAAARGLLYQACALADRGGHDIGKHTAMAKLFCSDTAMAVTVEAVQVLGGYGYVADYPVERLMRDAKLTQIYEGTNEIQRLVIARTLTKGALR